MKGPILSGTIILVGMYIFLKFILPLFTAPLPASLIYLYLALTLSGIMIFGTMSAPSLEAMLGPVFRFLSGEGQSGTGGQAGCASDVSTLSWMANIYPIGAKRSATC
jgi:hypothetical protein